MGFKLKNVLKGLFPFAANMLIPGAGTVLDGVIKDITGLDDEAEIEKLMHSNPEIYAQVLDSLNEKETELAREDTKRQQAVNETMRAELVSGNRFQRGWRPFNGYLFGITVFLSYPIPALFGKDIPNIPAGLWVMWAAVLGVSAHSRGREKLAKMGNNGPGLLESLAAGLLNR